MFSFETYVLAGGILVACSPLAMWLSMEASRRLVSLKEKQEISEALARVDKSRLNDKLHFMRWHVVVYSFLFSPVVYFTAAVTWLAVALEFVMLHRGPKARG